jgi:hypothetical protein
VFQIHRGVVTIKLSGTAPAQQSHKKKSGSYKKRARLLSNDHVEKEFFSSGK